MRAFHRSGMALAILALTLIAACGEPATILAPSAPAPGGSDAVRIGADPANAISPSLAPWALNSSSALSAYLTNRASSFDARQKSAVAVANVQDALRRFPPSEAALLVAKVAACGGGIAIGTGAVAVPEVAVPLIVGAGTGLTTVTVAACRSAAIGASLSAANAATLAAATLKALPSSTAAVVPNLQLTIFEQSVSATSAVTVTASVNSKQSRASLSGRCVSTNINATLAVTLVVQSGAKVTQYPVECRGGCVPFLVEKQVMHRG